MSFQVRVKSSWFAFLSCILTLFCFNLLASPCAQKLTQSNATLYHRQEKIENNKICSIVCAINEFQHLLPWVTLRNEQEFKAMEGDFINRIKDIDPILGPSVGYSIDSVVIALDDLAKDQGLNLEFRGETLVNIPFIRRDSRILLVKKMWLASHYRETEMRGILSLRSHRGSHAYNFKLQDGELYLSNPTEPGVEDAYDIYVSEDGSLRVGEDRDFVLETYVGVSSARSP